MASKKVQPTIFFLKMSCTKSGKWQLLSYSSFLCVLHCRLVVCCTYVFLLFRFFPVIVDVIPSVLVCNPDLFSLYRFMTFEQRYTTCTVAFIEMKIVSCYLCNVFPSSIQTVEIPTSTRQNYVVTNRSNSKMSAFLNLVMSWFSASWSWHFAGKSCYDASDFWQDVGLIEIKRYAIIASIGP